MKMLGNLKSIFLANIFNLKLFKSEEKAKNAYLFLIRCLGLL